MIVNRASLANVLGVSLPTVDSYVARGMPAVKRGSKGREWRFDVAACVSWLLEQERARADADSSPDLAEARRRKLAAEGALAEHALAVARGETIFAADLESALGGVFTRFRDRGLAAANKLAVPLASATTPRECFAMVDGEIRAMLEELSDYRDDHARGRRRAAKAAAAAPEPDDEIHDHDDEPDDDGGEEAA